MRYHGETETKRLCMLLRCQKTQMLKVRLDESYLSFQIPNPDLCRCSAAVQRNTRLIPEKPLLGGYFCKFPDFIFTINCTVK